MPIIITNAIILGTLIGIVGHFLINFIYTKNLTGSIWDRRAYDGVL